MHFSGTGLLFLGTILAWGTHFSLRGAHFSLGGHGPEMPPVAPGLLSLPHKNACFGEKP